jgi:hypothetical protein
MQSRKIHYVDSVQKIWISSDAVPENIMMSRGPQLQVLSREKTILGKTFLDGRLLPELIIFLPAHSYRTTPEKFLAVST